MRFFRPACPRLSTSELLSQKQRFQFKRYVGVSQLKRTSQIFQQTNVLREQHEADDAEPEVNLQEAHYEPVGRP